MKRLLIFSSFLLLLVLFATPAATPSATRLDPTFGNPNRLPVAQPNPVVSQADVAETLQSSPVMFIENVGQFDEDARFKVQGSNYGLWGASDALWITLLEAADPFGEELREPLSPDAHLPEPSLDMPRKGVNLKLSFVGANPQPEIEPFNLLDTKMNYFLGNDPDKWRSNVPVWGGVRYKEIYPGIDLELTSENGQTMQRFVASEDAALDVVRLRVEGADAMELLPSPKASRGVGDQRKEGMGLTVKTAIGDVSLPLFTLITPDGTPLDSNLSPTLNDNDIQAPFAVHQSQGSVRALSLSGSELAFSTFIGGWLDDYGNGLALDSAGNVLVTGYTLSSDFPTTPGSYDTSYDGDFKFRGDAFVLSLNGAGDTLRYSTFIGGSSDDSANALALDSAGNVFVTGVTDSSDFPTTQGSYDTSYNGGDTFTPDVFVLSLSAAGDSLGYSTFIGGSSNDYGTALALDSAGNVFVTGVTISSDFPTTQGSYDTSYNGDIEFIGDTFVLSLSAAGDSLGYSTFIGGSDRDSPGGLALDSAGNVLVTGYTLSSDFPTTPGSYDTSYNGEGDTFVLSLSAAGDSLGYSTFIGGSFDDSAGNLALDSAGNVLVTGYTLSSDFPTTPGSYDTSYNGEGDVFVLSLSAAGDSLGYSTFIGGSDRDSPGGLALDSAGNVFVTGNTESSDLPTTPGSYDTTYNGNGDVFVLQLSSTGDVLIYSTFLGSSILDRASELALPAAGEAVITGHTNSSNFPTSAGAYDTTLNSAGACNGLQCHDVFVARFSGLDSTPTPTPTRTPTNTPTPTPIPPDDYEPDNTCEDASPIPSDGTIQNHTFHAQNDQDWLSFEASEGMTTTITVRVPAGSLADVMMEVYGDCDTVIDPGQDPSFSPDVRFTFTAPTTGSYHLHLLNHDPNQYGADVWYNVSVRRLDSVVNPGALVVVAGRFFSNPIPDLQSNIQYVTNNVYNLFRAKNYPAERIYYLATELDIDATGEGQADVNALASKANLQYAITEWTADKELGEDRAFTLYLMDHGGENGTFYLDQPRGEQVTAQELDGWLDDLEADNPGVKVNIIIEASFSGGFLNGLSRSSGLQERRELLTVLGGINRIIITSTDAVALAYASPNGAWFSDSLLDALTQDMSLADAFDDARNSAQHANPAQEPFIDGNGNGTPNEEQDYQAAAARAFAIPGSFADDKWLPYIKKAGINEAKNGQAEIWAEVDDDQSLVGVSAVVYSPSYQPPSSQGELVSSPLPEKLHDKGNNEYAVLSSSFSEEGAYHIVFYAQDNQDLQARPVTIEFTIVGSYQLYLPAVRR